MERTGRVLLPPTREQRANLPLLLGGEEAGTRGGEVRRRIAVACEKVVRLPKKWIISVVGVNRCGEVLRQLDADRRRGGGRRLADCSAILEVVVVVVSAVVVVAVVLLVSPGSLAVRHS